MGGPRPVPPTRSSRGSSPRTSGASVVRLRGTTPPAAPVPAPAALPSPAGPVSAPRRPSLLDRAAGPPRGPRAWPALVARGLTTPDAAVARPRTSATSSTSVRRRQNDRRVVAFVAGQGGVGCTTFAVGVGTTFMALREDRSVVVDVSSGAGR